MKEARSPKFKERIDQPRSGGKCEGLGIIKSFEETRSRLFTTSSHLLSSMNSGISSQINLSSKDVECLDYFQSTSIFF